MSKARDSQSVNTPLGRLVRHWRKLRGMSQVELAERAGLSARHLSFLETGKTQPSRDAVDWLARALEVPEREMPVFLEAAGYLSPYQNVDPATVMDEIRLIVDGHKNPALCHNRFGQILYHNDEFQEIIDSFGQSEAEVPECGHTLMAALQPNVVNWEGLAEFYRQRLFRELVRGGAGEYEEQSEEALEGLYDWWVAQSTERNAQAHGLLMPLVLRTVHGEKSFRFYTTTCGTPQETHWRNFRILVFLPVDDTK